MSVVAASISAASDSRGPRSRSAAIVAAKRAQQGELGAGNLFQPLRLGQLRLAGAGGALERRPDVAPLAGRRPQQPEGVGGDRAGGRGEGAEEGVVVERVGDRRQQRADVGDLLLGPVAAAADHVGPQAGSLERVLIGVKVGEGAQQDDDLATVDVAVDQLAQAGGEGARLGQAVERSSPVDRRLQLDLLRIPAVAPGQQQLDGRAAPWLRPVGGGGAYAEGSVAVAEQRRAEGVDGGDHLGAGAEVAAQLHQLGVGALLDQAALLAEDVEVGVAEAVDRLELVADHDQLAAGPRSASISRSCRRLVSWNSSTSRWLKRVR